MKPAKTLVACALAVLSAVVSVGRDRRARRGEAAAPSAIDRKAMLNAIAAVETGNSPHKIGAHGERGRCQFMPATWRRYTNFPFYSWAGTNTTVTEQVERAHLAWLIQHLGVADPAPALIAAAWRHGPQHAHRFVREDYARRVANLYWAAVSPRAER